MESAVELWINWLWQGTALTLGIAGALAMTRSLNAATRERIWGIALAALASMPLLHLASQSIPDVHPTLVGRAGPLATRLTVQLPDAGNLFLTSVWVMWLIAAAVQLATALVRLRRAKARALPFDRRLDARLQAWRQVRASGRQTRLVISEDVHVAAVLGIGDPVIAIAPDTIARLTDGELDQIVMHEYAHVQRRDDYWITLHRVVTAICGLHPAAWWINRRLSVEREVACDDWVVSRTGGARQYASCLVELASAARTGGMSIFPAAARTRSQIAIRVTRLTDKRRNISAARSQSALWFAQPTMLGLAIVGAAFPLVAVSTPALPLLEVPSLVLRKSADVISTSIPELTVPSQDTARASGVHRRETTPRAGNLAATGVPASRGNMLAEDHSHAATTQPLTPESIVGRSTATVAAFTPGQVIPATPLALAGTPRAVQTPSEPPLWNRMGDVGVAIGKKSRDAGVGTGSFFSRFGKSVARTF